MLIYAATIHHKHGTNLVLAASEAQRTAQIADYCRDWWGDATNKGDGPAPLPDGDQAIVDAYFDNALMGSHEHVEIYPPEEVLA